jgi:hypothetical protein
MKTNRNPEIPEYIKSFYHPDNNEELAFFSVGENVFLIQMIKYDKNDEIYMKKYRLIQANLTDLSMLTDSQYNEIRKEFNQEKNPVIAEVNDSIFLKHFIIFHELHNNEIFNLPESAKDFEASYHGYNKFCIEYNYNILSNKTQIFRMLILDKRIRKNNPNVILLGVFNDNFVYIVRIVE